MTNMETLQGNWDTMYTFWNITPHNSIAEAIAADEMQKIAAKYETAFRNQYNVHDPIARESLIMADEEEKVRFLDAGKNVLILGAPFIKPERIKYPNCTDNRLRHVNPEVAISLIFEGVAWESYVDLSFNPVYHGLSAKGLMAQQGEERLDLVPVFVPLEHIRVHEFPLQ